MRTLPPQASGTAPSNPAPSARSTSPNCPPSETATSATDAVGASFALPASRPAPSGSATAKVTSSKTDPAKIPSASRGSRVSSSRSGRAGCSHRIPGTPAPPNWLPSVTVVVRQPGSHRSQSGISPLSSDRMNRIYRMDPVHLVHPVHPVRNPEPFLSSGVVGQDRVAGGWFPSLSWVVRQPGSH